MEIFGDHHIFAIKIHLWCSVEVNGIPTCLDPLMKAARAAWNFTGYVTSDSDAVSDAWRRHRYVQTPEPWVMSQITGISTFHLL